MAAVLLVGTAAFVTTPVPHGQAFLFLMAPWAAFLGTVATARYAEEPEEMRPDRWLLLGAGALCLAGLRWYNLLMVLAVWGPLLWVGVRRIRRDAKTANRLHRAFALLLALSLIVYLLRLGDSLRLREGRAQAQFLASVRALAPPDESMLQTWPVVAPFRPSPVYHVFAHEGLLRSLSAEALEREWLAAVETGRTRLVAAEPEALRRWTPRFARFLETHAVLLVTGPPNLNRVQVYRCEP